MKKALVLTSLMLTLCMVLAAFAGASSISDKYESDVGVYIRFDSQDAIDAHLAQHECTIAFDGEHAAARVDTRNLIGDPSDKALDNQLFIVFGKTVNVDEYPYFRLTYLLPETKANGEPNNYHGNGYFFGVKVGGGVGDCVSFNLTKGKKAVAYETTQYTSKFDDMIGIRLDLPNGVNGDEGTEYYLYDIGFFKTEAAMRSYNPYLESVAIDFSDPENATGFTWLSSSSSRGEKANGKEEYSEEQQAFKFTTTIDNEDNFVRNFVLPGEMFFNTADIPYESMKFKASIGDTMWWINNKGGATGGTGALTNSTNATVGYVGGLDQWRTAYRDLNKIPGYPIVLTGFGIDPFQSPVPSGSEFYLKYVAFYATEEEAKLEPQFPPEGLEVQPADSLEGKGLITGVTTDMEYSTDGSEWTPVTGDSITAEPGISYAVRYAAKEGYNASYPAFIGAPLYWELEITGVQDENGEDIAANITSKNNTHWNIELPYGADPTQVKLVYSAATQASETYTGPLHDRSITEITRKVYLTSSMKLASSSTSYEFPIPEIDVMDVSEYIDGEAQQLNLYQQLVVNEPVEITWTIADITIEGSTTAEQRADGELRFKTVLQQNWNDKISADTVVTYGTYVIPTRILDGKELDEDALADPELKDLIADVHGDRIYRKDAQSLTYTAVVTGIPPEYRSASITARAYVKFTSGETETVILLDQACASDFAAAPPAAE